MIFARSPRLSDLFRPVILRPGRSLDSSRLVNLLPSMVEPCVLDFGLEGGKMVKVVELGERREFYETDNLAAWKELTGTQATV